uniref:Uncharacterized protein n=1 Tax=uncultured Nocardioidaceae bacterium TaxID=253824 RepID=A0A6J4MIR3_9ACTN|nr:MAG: hypothetical protein AVDCRST_MAG46-3099 [uncultured Nocardioidaceae bacterium]
MSDVNETVIAELRPQRPGGDLRSSSARAASPSDRYARRVAAYR